jgi:hypothetical protein
MSCATVALVDNEIGGYVGLVGAIIWAVGSLLLAHDRGRHRAPR